MNEPDTFSRMLVTSDLIGHSIALRSEVFSPEDASNLVGWLVTEFVTARCTWLASAIAHVRGREHHVAFIHEDGRLAHAVTAVAPQFDPRTLKGYGCDILGRRPLMDMLAEINFMNSRIRVVVGQPMETSDFGDGELDAMIDLAAELPWCSSLVGRPRPEPDGRRLLKVAKRLGMICT